MSIFGRKSSDDETIVALLGNALRRDISFGVLAPDMKLKLAELKMRYGGSNHSLREALRVLSSEGLVAAEAQRGFRVASATEDDLIDTIRLRAEIECMGLGWAMAAGDVAWEGTVVAARHALYRAEQAVQQAPADEVALEWDEALRAFHAALISACRSPRMIALQKQLYDQSRRFLLAALREGRLDFVARHKRQDALLAAVLERDTALARELLRAAILSDLLPCETAHGG
ncbi:GntR family transcriptional regulator [Oceanibium sediminis]|uniref:GntR family transcriptional regulator n=1 Tax=Oceanibium sediminis TaxID=2026339 RepID=UPI000DD39F0B|nr:GntR family transcriptional regulator [Oceanibium sediminis]